MSLTLIRFSTVKYQLEGNVSDVFINPASVSRVLPRYVGAGTGQRIDGTRIYIGENAVVDVREPTDEVVAMLTGGTWLEKIAENVYPRDGVIDLDEEYPMDDAREPIAEGDYHYYNPRP